MAPEPRVVQEEAQAPLEEPEPVECQKNLSKTEKQKQAAVPPVRKHGLNVRIRSGCGGGGKGEVRLVKHNMAGYKNPTRGEIVAAVPLMVMGVTKEHTTGRARCELMRSSGSKVREASAPEDTKVVVSGRGTEESVVRSWSGRNGGRKTVEKVGGGVKTLYPEARGKGCLDQKSAHDIICGPNMRSALPFCGEVYGQDIQSWTLWVRKKEREVELSNSRLLLHWTALMPRPN
jgi:hypothetical protein